MTIPREAWPDGAVAHSTYADAFGVERGHWHFLEKNDSSCFRDSRRGPAPAFNSTPGALTIRPDFALLDEVDRLRAEVVGARRRGRAEVVAEIVQQNPDTFCGRFARAALDVSGECEEIFDEAKMAAAFELTQEEIAREIDKAFEACYLEEQLHDSNEERERLRAENERLRGVLSDAASEIEEWGAYADKHFQDRWDFAGTVKLYRDEASGGRNDPA